MRKPLRVLQLEDSDRDAALITHLLQSAGYDVDCVRVWEAESMRAALQNGTFDVIIADYHLPQFDAGAALEMLHATALDIPFIVVSGILCEEVAVAMMRSGAHDYLTKNNLARLAPAVERETRDARARLERKRAEQALQESEQRFRRLFESAVVGIAIADADRILEANDYVLDILGYTRPELEAGAITWARITPPDLAALEKYAEHQLLQTGRHPTVEQDYIAKDGKLVTLLVGRVVLDSTPDSRFLYFIVDVTDRKRLEQQFRQIQKLESIGQLTGGVAHDFNNLLTVISGYAHAALAELPPQYPVYEYIEEISKAANRAAELTRQLLTFSRREVIETKSIVLNDTVRDFDKMLRRLIGEDIQLILSLDPQAGMIRADRGQIEQAIMNLAINARDAMPNGGKLVIETASVFVDEQFPRMHPSVATGPYVMLTVSDTGSGMSQEVQSHVFEPFFTTKEKGRGTGLGLSTVYGIVKQSGGSIWVYSELGQGTRFKLFFPAAGPAPDEGERASTAATRVAGAETILVAEDEEGVRRFVRQILERNGYTVLESSSGREAIDVARKYAGPIGLLLTDAVMPEMGGAELAEQIAAMRPGVPVLCMSGYTDRIFAQPQASAAYIQKPFTSMALLTQIRALLDRVCSAETPFAAT